MQSLETTSGHSEMTTQFVSRHFETNAGELPEMTATALGYGYCWKPRRVAGDAHNMMENALSILIVIFLHNYNKQRPQTESCIFSDLAQVRTDITALNANIITLNDKW